MKPAKIVHLTSVHRAFDIRIFHKECRSLARAGHQVTFVVPHDKDELVDGVRFKGVPKAGGGRLSRMTKTVWKVYREAVRQDADVYHFHDSELIPVGLLLRARGKKVVYDVHEDVPRDLISKDYLPSTLRRPLGWLVGCAEKAGSRCLSGLVTVTPAIADRFKSHNHKTVVVHNFPLLAELTSPLEATWEQRSFSVAYAGGIIPDRGIRELVRALGLLPKGLNATLKLAGEFFPASFAEELANLPGWERVKVLGLLDRAGLVRTLRNVRAGLVPFLPEPNHIEAMPHKFFEYMSAGLPVIASDFPLWRRMIESIGCGLLINPRDPSSIANAIEHVLTHPREAEAMGRRGRQAVKDRFNWAHEEQKLLALYADLMEPSCAA
jgi:glycosyltransferase involved in cell wall biosynthesis